MCWPSVPSEYGVVRGLMRNFVPHRDDEGWFADRMTTRLAAAAPINDPATPFRPVVKVAHRAHPSVTHGRVAATASRGFHGRSCVPGIRWTSCICRSGLGSSALGSTDNTWTSWSVNLRGDLARAREVAEQGRPDAMWERVAVDDARLEAGLAQGSLVSDTRLRDAMRALRRGDRFAVPSADGSHGFALPTRSEQAAHALEAAVFDEAETVRSQRWVDEIEARVARLERRGRWPGRATARP